jgi:hypothetical protein
MSDKKYARRVVSQIRDYVRNSDAMMPADEVELERLVEDAVSYGYVSIKDRNALKGGRLAWVMEYLLHD